MTDNLKLKLISLASAILLWIYVVASVNPTVEKEFRNIPIVYKNLDYIYSQGLDVLGERDTSVDVTLSGNTNDFIKINESDIRAEVDLTNYDEGSTSIPISFYAPEGLTITDTSISAVPIKIEKVISKELKVELHQEGTPGDNFAVVVGSIIPETIVVEGARSLVDRATSAVAVQDMEEISSDTTRNVPVFILDSNGEGVPGLDLSQNFVNVSYDTYKVESVPIEFVTEGSYKDDISINSVELSQEEVSIMIPVSTNAIPETIKTKVFDLSQIDQSESYPLSLEVPEGVRLRDPNVEISVIYDISPKVDKTFTIRSTDIEIRNSSHDDVEIEDTNVRFVLSGKEELISQVKKEDINLFIDAEGLSAGRHNLRIQVEDMEDITVKQINPERINVQLGSD